MGWQDLLETKEEQTLPWFGGRKIYYRNRSWDIKGRLPPEYGWYAFNASGGREATLARREPVDAPQDLEKGHKLIRGYLVGDRLISDNARVDPDPDKLIDQTEPVYLVEIGLERFTRAVVVQLHGALVYLRQEFPQGPEDDVMAAYQDRLESLGHLQGVTPPLDLAFRWISQQRLQAEERERERARIRAEEERKRLLEERMAEARKSIGTGAGRRALALHDFPAAARAALAISGAELLDSRPSTTRGEMVVQYRFRARRLECVCDMNLRIVDAGVCLTDHRGHKGDTDLTLESLPVIIREALDTNRLHIYRYVDRRDQYDDYGDDE